MKNLIICLSVVLTLVSCKKSTSDEDTQSLNVAEQNMSAMGKVTAAWCGPCGSWGFPKFAGYETDYEGKAVFMAFKDALIPGGKSEELYSEVGGMFNMDISGVPTFWVNFKAKTSDEASAVEEHNSSPVIVNSNYNMSISGNKVSLQTTTKFFQDAEGDYLLVPLMIVDGIVGNQAGHADGVNTVHHKVVAEVAKPTSGELNNWGYKIGSGQIKEGHTVTLEFEAVKDPTWKNSDISFGLIMVKEQGDSLSFVNAFTK